MPNYLNRTKMEFLVYGVSQAFTRLFYFHFIFFYKNFNQFFNFENKLQQNATVGVLQRKRRYKNLCYSDANVLKQSALYWRTFSDAMRIKQQLFNLPENESIAFENVCKFILFTETFASEYEDNCLLNYILLY